MAQDAPDVTGTTETGETGTDAGTASSAGTDAGTASSAGTDAGTASSADARRTAGAAPGTAGTEYADRLRRLETARWKRVLDVQAPYRWNIRRLHLGRTLDVGCGIGRNLAHLGGDGVGVDHNPTSVAIARSRGLEAYTVEEFRASRHATPGAFDALLAAHLVEHLPEPAAREVVGSYLDYLRPGGRAVFITPQEKGYTTDSTHVRFCGFAEVAALARALGLTVVRQYSFPFPRWAGKIFAYNEFVVVARKAGQEGVARKPGPR